MREFIITVNSTCDLPEEWLISHQVPFLKLKYHLGDKTYTDMGEQSPKEFFGLLRAGEMPTTSQVNPEEAREFFEPLVKEGKDILHIAFSSGLSGTCNSMMMAARDLEEDYPGAKVTVIDSLCACMGEAIMLRYALEQKEAGKSMAEISQWVEDNKLRVNHVFTVDDLNHLKRGGRVSSVAAAVGSLMKVKPILFMNNQGGLEPYAKERGRKKALNKIAEIVAEGITDKKMVMIAHGDCLEDAEYVRDLIREKTGVEDIMINFVGSVIGSHTGAGLITVFFMGDKRFS